MGDLGYSLGFTHIVKRTDVPTDEAAEHAQQSVLSLSHYPDNTSAGAVVGMCRSSVGSLGTAKEQFVPPRVIVAISILKITCSIPADEAGA